MDIRKFDTDRKFIMNLLDGIARLALINVLTLLFSIPIITSGAALCAMHDCLQQMVRKEEGYTFRHFVASFKKNFKQSTLLLLPFIPVFFGITADMLIQFISPGLLPAYILVPAGIAATLAFFIFQWVFPIQVRFKCTVLEVYRLALFLSGARFPRTAAMAMMWLIPVLLFRFLSLWPLCFFFGIALPGFLNVLFYLPVFTELENEEMKK